MAEEIPSGWVPDKLPEFRSRMIPITIDDPRLSREVLNLASSFEIEPIELCRKIVTFGLVAARIEEDPNSTLVERDSMGKETKVSLMDEVYSVKAEKINDTSRNRKLVFSIPGELADEFMELANKHHTTIDVVLIKMISLGIKVAKAQTDRSISYIIKNKEGSEGVALF